MIRFTFLGIIYFLFSILLFLFGFLRGEIFSLVCATSLLLYFAFTFFTMLITFLFWKNIKFKIILNDNKIIVVVLKNNTELKNKIICLPGVIPLYNFIFFTGKYKHSRILNLNIKIKDTKTEFNIPQNDRGKFLNHKEYFMLVDIAGFFNFYITQIEKTINKIYIKPNIRQIHFFELPKALSRTDAPLSNYQRSDELYETRPYLPGDDTRKINWKLFAHINELSIKQGDFIPPQQKFFTLYVDQPSVIKPNQLLKKKYDAFIEKIASIATYLYDIGVSFEIVFYDEVTSMFQKEVIYAEDKTAEEKIKKAFSIPQIKIGDNNFVISKFSNIEYKNLLLCFFMPHNFFDTTLLKKITYHNKQNIALYFGIKQKLNKPKSLVESFLFTTHIEKKSYKYTRTLNLQIDKIIDELTSEDFYANDI